MLLVLLVVMFTVSLFSVSEELSVKLLEQRRGQTKQWIVGKGEASSELEADKLALKDLASQISVTVKGGTEYSSEESTKGNSEYFKAFVTTYSNVELGSVEKYVKEVKKGKYIVYRFLKMADKEIIFKERLNKIISLVSEGECAEANKNYADALRNYYWGYTLLRTHPDKETITYFMGDEEKLLITALPNTINSIITNIEISVVNVIESETSNCIEYVLEAKYHNKPVNGILVKHNDGYGWSKSESWNSGKGIVILNREISETLSILKLEIDPTYSKHGYQEVFSSIAQPTGLNLAKDILLKDAPTTDIKEDYIVEFSQDIDVNIASSLQTVLESIDSGNISSSRRYCTASGFNILDKLMTYGKAKILLDKSKLVAMNVGNHQIIRSVPIRFDFRDGAESFTEDVNFVFDKNSKLSDVTFSISPQAIEDIMSKDADYATPEEKALIVDFIEKYKTAYCLKDIGFLENVFAEDALIIVGRVIGYESEVTSDALEGSLGKEIVEYIKLEKGEYIDRLQKQFSKKEMINIRFTDNKIQRVESRSERMFGIQIAQYYYSSDYSDMGYLFLMFNLNNIDKPKITVRSWQPEKLPDGKVIGVNNIEID